MDPNLAPQNPRKSGVFTVNLHIKRAQTAFRQVYVNCHSLNFTIAKQDVFSPNLSYIYFIELTVKTCIQFATRKVRMEHQIGGSSFFIL